VSIVAVGMVPSIGLSFEFLTQSIVFSLLPILRIGDEVFGMLLIMFQ
jgi:hypothetical protein